jgi:hypothetical protein
VCPLYVSSVAVEAPSSEGCVSADWRRDDAVGGAAFPAHLRLAVGEVQVRQVQGEDLVRPGPRFLQHPPQGLIPQRHVVTGEQPVEVMTGKGTAAVGRRAVVGESRQVELT